MARQRKRGLGYFPFDVDFFTDIKIRKLIKRQGGKAITVYALLLCFIYRDGYYMRWDEELPFIISEQTGYEEAYIREVLKCCLSLGLFDAGLFSGEKILTSEGIQNRYLSIIITLKRKPDMDKYVLIHADEEKDDNISSPETGISSEEIVVSSPETGIPSEEIGVSSGFMTTKEKEKKRKEKEKIPPKPPMQGGDLHPGFSSPHSEEACDTYSFDVVRLYNEITGQKLPPVERITTRRKNAIQRALNEFGPKVFRKLFHMAAESAFLTGDNAKHWRADFDWLLRTENIVKTLEGTYDSPHASPRNSGATDYAELIRIAEEDVRKRKQQKEAAVSREQYLELRRRAEQGDTEAARLITQPT